LKVALYNYSLTKTPISDILMRRQKDISKIACFFLLRH
jgi:hypothetical protein